jgi:hypothetical protein
MVECTGGWWSAGGDSDGDGGGSAPFVDATYGIVAKKRKTMPSSGSVEVASTMCTDSQHEVMARLGEQYEKRGMVRSSG